MHSLAISLTLALVSKLKGLSASTTIKITVRECCTLKDCKGGSKFKELPGSVTKNKLPSCVTNKSTVREYKNKKNACDYHNQKYC